MLLLCSSVLSVIWRRRSEILLCASKTSYFVQSSESGDKNIPRQLLLLTTGAKRPVRRAGNLATLKCRL